MTIFTTWPFPATAPLSGWTMALRTLPNRLSDVRNAADFGAVPGTDGTAAIQAAVTAAVADASGAGGTVYIPPGTYDITSPITFNDNRDFGLCVRGAGSATLLQAGAAGVGTSGYIFDRHLGTPNNTYGPRMFENMALKNSGSGGCIRLGSTIGGGMRNCTVFAGGAAFTSEDAAGSSSQNITIDDCVFKAPAATGSHSIILGGNGAITGCDMTGIDIGVRLYGGGIAMTGTRFEHVNTGILLGLDSAGTDRGLKGFIYNAGTMEGCVTFIDFSGTVTGFSIGPLNQTGHDATNTGTPTGVNPSKYGIYIHADKAYAGEIVAVGPGSFINIAGIYVEDYTTRAFVTFSNCNSTVGGGAGIEWRIPTATSGFKFIECNIDSSTNAPNGTRYAFSGLPGSSDRLEGDEYDLYDANTTTIGNNVTAGGSTGRVRVRWNSTNWVCVGP